MKSTLNIYILRSLLAPFALVLSVLLLALSMERMLRLIEQVTTYGAPFSQVFELLAYLLPHYLSLALPPALFMSVLLAFRRLHNNAELDALQASGVSLRQLLTPVLGFSFLIMIVMLFLTAFAQPHTRYMFRDKLHTLKEQPFDFALQPGIFKKLGQHVTIRTDETDRASNTMIGFFAAIDHKDGRKSYFSAQSAQVRQNPKTEELTIMLIEGRQVTLSATGKTQSLAFKSYPWVPDMDALPYGPRGQDERELTLRELVVKKIENLTVVDPVAKIRSELHARLVQSVSLPFLAILAIPLALLGKGRTARASGFVIGVAVLILYEKILGLAEAFAAGGHIAPWAALWSPFILLALSAWVFFHLKAERA